MPISNNRIILTDVDGVLLEWEAHFTDWMLKRSYYNDKEERIYPYKLLQNKQNTYEMADRFGLSVTDIRKEIREFNKSAWMGTQQPMPDSQTWVFLKIIIFSKPEQIKIRHWQSFMELDYTGWKTNQKMR